MFSFSQLPLTPLNTTRHALSHLTDPSTPLLPFIPKSIKLVLFLLLLLNSASFPLSWHVRLWYYPLRAYYYVYTKGRKKYLEDWTKGVHQRGDVNIKTRIKRIATFDDCDYNLHLSNSCYAKNTDAARMDWCIEAMAPVFTPNVHMALGASHYVFIKEIPLGSEYVMETRVGGWGEKWIYLVTEFIICKQGSKGRTPDRNSDLAHAGPVIPSISAPVSGTSTPLLGSSTPASSEEARRTAALRSREPREDGGIVAALSVAEYCFKAGRVTIPPRVALQFAMLSHCKEKRDAAQSLILNTRDRGGKWIQSGWKEEADASTIGLDIGYAKGEWKGVDKEAGWVETGRKGMERVVEGLSEICR